MTDNSIPKFIDEISLVRAENQSLYREITSLKEMNEFLRSIIVSLISNRAE